jgi:hypothetical protein
VLLRFPPAAAASGGGGCDGACGDPEVAISKRRAEGHLKRLLLIERL